MATEQQKKAPPTPRQSASASQPDKNAGYPTPPQNATTAAQSTPEPDPAVVQAIVQFNQIVATVGYDPVAASFAPSRAGCDKKLEWCLPEPACSAQLTLTSAEGAILAEHLKGCKPIIVN